jgi:polyvinyl alcohol dehydrogenase (cytochrome)
MKWRPPSLIGVLLAATGVWAATDASAANWLSAGADLGNSRYQNSENRISSQTVGSLTLKWTFTTAGDVTAHPAVEGNFVYFPDSAGYLYKVEKKTGALVWKRPISDYTGVAADVARGTPAIAGNLLILGDLAGRNTPIFGQGAPSPAKVFAVDKNSGNPVWVTQVDDTVMSFVTNSPIVFQDTVFTGVASNEELMAALTPPPPPPAPVGWQWQFRGSVVALNVNTGAIKWKTYTVPVGYYGGSVWGSTGAVDKQNNLLFMTTGNNYMVPQSVLTCLGVDTPAHCISPDDHFDSLIALDLDTGAIKWGQKGLDDDIWNVACGLLSIPGFPIAPYNPYTPGVYGNCPNANPTTAGPDYDFAQGPMLLGDDLVGAGQKSGKFWAFNRKTGALAWSVQAAPGGITGGLQWGSATDGDRIFFAASNAGTSQGGGGAPWPQVSGPPVTSGGWGALDRKTGAALWTTPDPLGSRSEAPVSGANDVVFGCNLAFGHGTRVAMDANTGAILWSYDTGGLCNAGASISGGMVIWGSGTFAGTGVQKVFGFGLPGDNGDD